jgi:competence protein ComEC
MPVALAAFVAGVFVLQLQAELPPVPALIAGAIATFASAASVARLRGRNPRAAFGLAVAGAAIAGYVYAALVAELRLGDELRFDDEGRDVRIVGIVASLPAQQERGTRFEFEVEQTLTPGIHVPARIALGWYDPQAIVHPAERWEFEVRLRRPHGSLNPGGFDYEAWLLERNLRATGYVRLADVPPRRIDEWVWRAAPLADRARDLLRERLQRQLQGARYGGVISALVLGDQRAIPESDWALFNRTGISHLVSISGLHITMIAGLAAFAIGALWRRMPRLLALAPVQTAAAIGAVVTALAYCLLAGWGVPAQRTFLMLAIVALAFVLRLATRPALTLALAAAAVCVLDPWAVIAPGFWLSFGAVAAILLALHGRVAPAAGWRFKLREAGRVQLAVTLGLVPLTVALFQQVALVSPLANAVAIPVVSWLVTPLALIGAALVCLPAPLDSFAVPMITLAHWLFEQLALLLAWLVAVPWSGITAPAPHPITLALALVGTTWLLAPPGWPQRWLGAVWLAPLFVWPAPRPAADELWLTAIDVGQGAAVLAQTHEAAVLFDAGPRYTPQANAGDRVILPLLRHQGVERLDLLIVSHLDIDHSGGAASILRALPVRRLWTSIDPAHPTVAGAASAQRCVDGQTLDLGQLHVRVLRPVASDYAGERSTNAMSCVVAVRFGAHRILLTGDMPAREEGELTARQPDLKATVVAAPHHGSRHSSSAKFVDATTPAWVVFQSGYRNRFGHPAPEVVERYENAGAKVVRTDHFGAVRWRLRGDGAATFEAWRRDHRRYWHNRPGLAAEGSSETDAATADPENNPTESPAGESTSGGEWFGT